jgi:hypothetical protein
MWSALLRCGDFLAVLFGGRFFFFAGFVARWTLDFARFCCARLAGFLRTDVRLTLLRFEPFLRAATRFFALAISASFKIPAHPAARRAPLKDSPIAPRGNRSLIVRAHHPRREGSQGEHPERGRTAPMIDPAQPVAGKSILWTTKQSYLLISTGLAQPRSHAHCINWSMT